MTVFRVDGNNVIGSGHIMRCLSIAYEIQQKDDVVFVVSDSYFFNFIENKGFNCINLEIDYKELPKDNKFIDYLLKEKPQFVFIDSYYVDNVFFNKVKRICKTIYIDDLLSFPYNVDVLINYNIYGEYSNYKKLYEKENFIPMLLLGPKYAPLRKEFRNLEEFVIRPKCKNIFVSTGGADPLHLALRLISYIIDNHILQYTFHFIVGIANNDKDEMIEISKNYKNIILHYNVENISKLMMRCDIAITAAGSTAYELCACGIPTISYILADNQILGAEAFDKKGIMKYCGDARYLKHFSSIIFSNIYVLDNKIELRRKLSINMQKIVDGKGSLNILDEIF